MKDDSSYLSTANHNSASMFTILDRFPPYVEHGFIPSDLPHPSHFLIFNIH